MRELEERLARQEATSEELSQCKEKLEDEVSGLKGDVEGLELHLQKAEQEKQTKDNQIRTLNEEMARQDESISKMQKDKKQMDQTIKQTQEALAAEEDKVNHLNKLKAKLEQNVDEVSIPLPSLKAQYTPPTPTRRNRRVASCRRCEHTRRQS